MSQDTESLEVLPAASTPGVGRRRRWAVLAALSLVLTGFVVLKIRSAGAPHDPSDHAVDVPGVEGRTVTLSAKLRERLGIETAPVLRARLTPIVLAVGTATFDPAYVGAVGVRLRGVVRDVLHFEGDVVKRGELLGSVVSSELGSAQASVLMYGAQLHSAELNANRESDLASRGLTTTREVEEAAAAVEEFRSKLLASEQQISALGGAPVKDRKVRAIGVHQLRSPIDGTLVERFVAPGQSVDGNLTAFRVADLTHLWVELAVYERNLGAVRVGDHVEFRPLSERDQAISGEVAHVGETVDPSTRAGDVRVEVENTARTLRPGQAVSAEIHATGRNLEDVTQVPNSAVTYIDGKPMVFVAESALRFVATPVVIGESDGEHRRIISGVEPGRAVVEKGVFGLKSELFR